MTSARDNKALVPRFCDEVVGHGNLLAADLMDADYVHHDPNLPPAALHGRDDFPQRFSMFGVAFPDYRLAVDPCVSASEWVLTSEGAEAARALVGHPALATAETIFTSPELKAVATARATAGERPVREVADLRELDRRAVGWLATPAEYAALVADVFSRTTESVRGCESAVAAQRRFVQAVDLLLAANKSRPLALVSHGIVLTLYLSYLLGLAEPDLRIWQTMRLPDLAVVDPIQRRTIVEFGRG